MWQLLYDRSPFEGFDPAAYPDDLQGWGSDDPIFETVIGFARPRLIVEVGSWKGRSAVNMAGICRRLGLDTKILCVDTWLGNPEVLLKRTSDPEPYRSMQYRHGWPHLYFQFLANVARRGLHDVITPLPQTSDNAAHLIRALNLVPDIVYIDAAHEYPPVIADLRAYYPLLRDNGVLLGDDFGYAEGVDKAVREFSFFNRVPFFGRPGKFVMVKNGDMRSIPGLQ